MWKHLQDPEGWPVKGRPKWYQLITHPEINLAFQELVRFEGLWAETLPFGNTSWVSIGGHAREIIKYLNAIRDFWGSLPKGSADASTVKLLHLRCPGVPTDKKYIEGIFMSRLIFRKLSQEDRKKALDAVLSTSFHIIPTLLSFCRNCRWLGTHIYPFIHNPLLIVYRTIWWCYP